MNEHNKASTDLLPTISKIHLTDFRCFDTFDMDFNVRSRHVKNPDDGTVCEVGPLTVLVAKNGMGKTAILDAVCTLLGLYLKAFPGLSPVHARPSDIRIVTGKDNAKSRASQLVVQGTIRTDSGEKSVKRELASGIGARTTIKDAKAISDYASDLRRRREMDASVDWPIFALYGTGRLWRTSKVTDKTQTLLEKADFGYANCLGHTANFRGVEDWLSKAVSKRGTDKADGLLADSTMELQIQAVTRALEHVLTPEGYVPELTVDWYLEELAVKQETRHGRIAVPVSSLSDGVRAAFGLFADLAFRCAKLNPHLGADAARLTSGIVMIDEVDMHLHPAWQQKILNELQRSFPRMQFIVTTHSPQVVSSVPKYCLRMITDGEIQESWICTEGAKAAQVLKEIFGTSERVSSKTCEVTALLEEYYELLDAGRWDSEQGKRIRRQLDEYLGTDPEMASLSIDEHIRAYHRGHMNEKDR